jgi:hypothetical protein
MINQSTKYKHKIAYLPLRQPLRTKIKLRRLHKYKKCNKCNRRIYKIHQICPECCKTNIMIKSQQSGNKLIDDFITYTQTKCPFNPDGKLEFVPYNQFKDIEFIADGGFGTIYKATWVNDSNITSDTNQNSRRHDNETVVVLKKLNSKNITSEELNEV